jgi:hypothetical protein
MIWRGQSGSDYPSYLRLFRIMFLYVLVRSSQEKIDTSQNRGGLRLERASGQWRRLRPLDDEGEGQHWGTFVKQSSAGAKSRFCAGIDGWLCRSWPLHLAAVTVVTTSSWSPGHVVELVGRTKRHDQLTSSAFQEQKQLMSYVNPISYYSKYL